MICQASQLAGFHHSIKYAKILVFNDPYSRIFYVVFIIRTSTLNESRSSAFRFYCWIRIYVFVGSVAQWNNWRPRYKVQLVMNTLTCSISNIGSSVRAKFPSHFYFILPNFTIRATFPAHYFLKSLLFQHILEHYYKEIQRE